jgi:(p)ppGpp synthase/HD superfamily hydrolase
LKELQKMFGVKITQIIFLLSKNVPITPEMRALFGELAGDWLELPFFERLLAIPDLTLRIWCIVLKVVDRIDNLKTLKGMGHGRISRKIKETEEKIPPLLKHLEEVVEKSNPLHEVVENLGREYASALTLAKKTLAQEA